MLNESKNDVSFHDKVVKQLKKLSSNKPPFSAQKFSISEKKKKHFMIQHITQARFQQVFMLILLEHR